MSVARLIPKRIRDQQDANMSPGAGTNGYAIVYNHTSGKFELGTFEAAGAASAVAAHVAAGDPHTQYALESALGTMAAATETNYLLADGSRAGATAARQVFANGITAPSWRPASDSTTALQLQNAAGTAVMTVNTTDKSIVVSNSAMNIGARTGGVISFYPTNAINSLFEIFPYTGNATEYTEFSVYGYGTVAGIATYHRLQFGFRPGSPGQYAIWVQGAGISLPRLNIGFSGQNDIVILPSGLIGMGNNTTPTALLDLGASTTARASLRVRAGTAPTTPNAGDIWYPTGGRLSLYRAATEIFATGVQATGGSATAGATWTSTEQGMLQKVYDIARAFGMLS